MSAPLSKAERQAYLQKYLSSTAGSAKGTTSADGRKLKKRKKSSSSAKTRGGIRIIDHDVDFGSIGYGKEELYEEEEDERPALETSDLDEDEAFATRVAVRDFEASGQHKKHGGGEKVASGRRSPPRRRERHDSPDPSPPRRRERHDSPDLSPPRRRERHDSPDPSPPRRRGRHDSPDPSPPRRREHHDSPDPSPPRPRKRHDSPDPSPPRRRGRHDSPDPSPPRRREHHDAPDPSPPRRREHHDAPDPSPPRRRERHDSPDPSPPRRRGRHDSPDPSPPRRRHQRSSPDRSPPRHRTAQSSSDATAPTNRTARESDSSPTAKKQGGLQTNVAAEVAQLKQAQSRQIEASDPAELGAGADTVRRDRHGRKLEGLNAMLEMERSGDGAAKPVKPVWGSGLAQQRSKKEQREYEREWANKPLAQYEDNAERDASKRAIERWGDPMAGRLALDKAKAKSNRPKYRGPPAPPNRFDIPPGHKWDGVDRSNGYEKQFFLAQADARSKAELAHKWAVEDM